MEEEQVKIECDKVGGGLKSLTLMETLITGFTVGVTFGTA